MDILLDIHASISDPLLPDLYKKKTIFLLMLLNCRLLSCGLVARQADMVERGRLAVVGAACDVTPQRC